MRESIGNSSKKSGVISMVATCLFVAAIIYLSIEKGSVARTESKLNAERLKSEVMLSEKLILEKEIDNQRLKISQLRDSNENLSRSLQFAEQGLRSHERDEEKLKIALSKASEYEKRFEEQLSANTQVQEQLAAERNTTRSLQSALEVSEQRITSIRFQNENLVAALEEKPVILLNNVRIEPASRRNILTLQARRTKKITIHLDIVPSLENPSFEVIDPSGNAVRTPSADISMKVIEPSDSYWASRERGTVNMTMKKIEMTYNPQAKLKKGTYTIHVEHDTLSIVSLQVRLR